LRPVPSVVIVVVASAAADANSAVDQRAAVTIDLARQALTQSHDRFAAGVTNNIEVVQAQESLVNANDSYVGAFYAHDLANLYGTNPMLTDQVRALSRYLHARGASTSDATHQAYGQIYGLLQRQVKVLSYVDAFWILAIVCLLITPIVFVARRPEPGQAAIGH